MWAWWRSVGISSGLIAGLYALKGWYGAFVLGGAYPIAAAVEDMLGAALVVLALRGLDLGLDRGLRRLFRASENRVRMLAARVSRAGLLVAIAVPFLFAIVQFHPQRVAGRGSPADLGIAYRAVRLKSSAGRLAAWFVPGPTDRGPVVLMAHGIGVNKENFLPAVALVHDLGYSVFIFDFRAHGASDGRVTTFGYLEAADVRAAVSWIRAELPGRPIHAMGFSMGGAAVLRVAAESDAFDRIIIDSSFARAESVARASVIAWFGVLQTPAWHLGRFWGWLISGVDLANHEPRRSIAAIRDRPILLIHGLADELIPVSEARDLAHAAGAGAELWLIPGTGHLGALAHPDYVPRISAWLNQTAKRSP